MTRRREVLYIPVSVILFKKMFGLFVSIKVKGMWMLHHPSGSMVRGVEGRGVVPRTLEPTETSQSAIRSKRLATINYKIFLYRGTLNNATLEAAAGSPSRNVFPTKLG